MTTARNEKLSHLFEPCAVMYGDRRVNGARARCGRCNAAEEVPVNRQQGNPDDDIQASRIAEKFRAKGWHIGARTRDDRCPECVKLSGDRLRKKFKVIEPAAQQEPKQETTMPPSVPASPASIALVNSGPSRQDKRTIISKLEEVYNDAQEHPAYRPGWNDTKVSMDLGVDVGWVRDIRQELFGPEGVSPEVARAMAELRGLVKTGEELKAKIDNHIGLYADISAKLKAAISDFEAFKIRFEAAARNLDRIERHARGER